MELLQWLLYICLWKVIWKGSTQITRFMRPTRADKTQVGPMLVPWTLLSEMFFSLAHSLSLSIYVYIYIYIHTHIYIYYIWMTSYYRILKVYWLKSCACSTACINTVPEFIDTIFIQNDSGLHETYGVSIARLLPFFWGSSFARCMSLYNPFLSAIYWRSALIQTPCTAIDSWNLVTGSRFNDTLMRCISPVTALYTLYVLNFAEGT